jgi:hypothetical protein
LPGEFVYGAVGAEPNNIAPRLLHESLIAFVVFGVSLLWYFAICDFATLIFRLVESSFENQGVPKSR